MGGGSLRARAGGGIRFWGEENVCDVYGVFEGDGRAEGGGEEKGEREEEGGEGVAGGKVFGGGECCAAGRLITNRASLLRHHFIDPDACYVRIALRHLLCIIKAVGAHDQEAGDGFKPQWQILGSSFRDFSTTREMALFDNIVFD